jgi:hypothetical protein
MAWRWTGQATSIRPVKATQETYILEVTPSGEINRTATTHFVENLTLDAAGNLFLASDACCIIKLSASGAETGIASGLSRPEAIAFDSGGNLYFAEGNQMRLRRISPDGTISTVAGNGTMGYSGDGVPAVNAQVSADDVALDRQGNLYFTDPFNAVVRKINVDGTIATVAGMASRKGYSGDGGPATAAMLSSITGIALDGGGNLLHRRWRAHPKGCGRRQDLDHRGNRHGDSLGRRGARHPCRD